MEIIGLIGHQGVGKNYIAEKILFNFLKSKPTIILAFADHFKIDSIGKFDLDYDKVYKNKDFETRKKLQIIGTEEGRGKYGDDIWIKTDVRFQNEADWIKSLSGILIKIDAPNRYMNRVVSEAGKNLDRIKDIILHPSEKNIDNIQNYDVCIQNDLEDNINDEIIKIYPLFREFGKN